MNSINKPQCVSEKDLDIFLATETANARCQLLDRWKQRNLTLDDTILRGLMKLPLSQNEVITAFELCSTQSKSEFELWVMDHLLSWDQNIAAVALRAWARNTDGLLWHRLMPISMIPGLTQRIRFTILDIAPITHGYELVKATLASPEWEDLSSAFHALLFERALQFDLPSVRLTTTAWKIANEAQNHAHPEHKALLPTFAWLCRTSSKDLKKWCENAPSSLWKSALESMISTHEDSESVISKLEKLAAKPNASSDIIKKLPALWSRQAVSSNFCEFMITSNFKDTNALDGVPLNAMLTSMGKVQPTGNWQKPMLTHLPYVYAQKITNPSDQFCISYQTSTFPILTQSRTLASEGKLGIANDLVKQVPMFTNNAPVANRISYSSSYFFGRLAGVSIEQPKYRNIWTHLDEAINNVEKCDLNQLTAETRKYKGVVSLAQITLLARMKGKDEAVLKLLDHIRSEDECELRAVARALGQINTARSHLELIAMITRPNSTVAVKQEIVAILHGKDLSSLQSELRSAVHDITLQPNSEDPLFQIKDELSGMLTPTNQTASSTKEEFKAPSGVGEVNLDQELGNMIPHYTKLSSEVKRALRTALFFNKTVEKSEHLNSIDLSPLIDMQYKAMELLYREFFEDTVSNSLQKGAIQRKLDIIGYARPIVRQMDDFEAYVASLPVVRDIPFFSKFKLRKMLRAICQFEPGRRFTLDGLKAFGLYFLVFGRQNCKHGLANTFLIGSKNDLELAEFCRELHVFQDFRNRAAHEGFHPDASKDVMGIWRTTASVVQWAFVIKDAQKSANMNSHEKAS